MLLHRTRSLLLTLATLLPTACAYEATGEALDHAADADGAVAAVSEALFPKSTVLWPQDRPIPVCWESFAQSDATARGWVRDAVARSWQAASNARFTGWNECTSTSGGIRIQVIDSAVITPHVKFLGKGLDGIGNGMSLNFTYQNYDPFCAASAQRERCIRATAVHEFGHALGFSHEHNRADTPKALCGEPPQGANGDLLFGAWDERSTMNYCNPIANNDGILSATDAARVRALYGTRKVEDFGFDAGGWRAELHVRTVADVNGDGRDDVVGFGKLGVWVSLARAAGGFDPPGLFIADFGFESGWRNERHVRTMADVNGDGRSDIVAFGERGVWLALSGGTMFHAPTFLADFGFESGWRVGDHLRTTGDVDGDGRADIVAFGRDGVWIALSVGGSFGAPQFVLADMGFAQGWNNAQHVRTVADVDGDGRDDAVGFGFHGVSVARSNGAGFGAMGLFTGEFGFSSNWRVENNPRMMADVNIDGRADVVGFGSDGVWVALSGGGTFYPAQRVLGDMGTVQGWQLFDNPRFVADVSGDGRPDLVGFGFAGVYVSTALGGSAFGPMQLWAVRHSPADAVMSNGQPLQRSQHVRGIGDFDGDGAGDVFAFRADGFHTTDLSLHLVPAPVASSRVAVLGGALPQLGTVSGSQAR